MEALGLSFVGPQTSGARQADPWPEELPPDSKNVPTYHSNRQTPATATRQLDFVFASEGLANSFRVRWVGCPGDDHGLSQGESGKNSPRGTLQRRACTKERFCNPLTGCSIALNRRQAFSSANRRIVIDTQFTAILKPGWHRDETLSNAYLYQICVPAVSSRPRRCFGRSRRRAASASVGRGER